MKKLLLIPLLMALSTLVEAQSNSSLDHFNCWDPKIFNGMGTVYDLDRLNIDVILIDPDKTGATRKTEGNVTTIETQRGSFKFGNTKDVKIFRDSNGRIIEVQDLVYRDAGADGTSYSFGYEDDGTCFLNKKESLAPPGEAENMATFEPDSPSKPGLERTTEYDHQLCTDLFSYEKVIHIDLRDCRVRASKYDVVVVDKNCLDPNRNQQVRSIIQKYFPNEYGLNSSRATAVAYGKILECQDHKADKVISNRNNNTGPTNLSQGREG